MNCRLLLFASITGMVLGGAASAQPSESSPGGGDRRASFPIARDAVIETGDTWIQAGTRLRLYGVQACLRGTRFTNAAGAQLDCGEASLAMLAALIKDTRPDCLPVAQQPAQQTFAICYTSLNGQRIELGTLLIASGFAFAALKPDGAPVHRPYFVAEEIARSERRGLWAAADLPHPNVPLLRALPRAGRGRPVDVP